jgi:anti-anti-sigma factor
MLHEPMTFEDSIGGLGWDGHLLLLHRSEPERRSRLAMWVRRGLERDEKVIFAQARTVPPQRSVLSVLAQEGIDVQAATARGQLLVLPLEAVYHTGPDGKVTWVEHALAEGFRGLRLSGEASAAVTVVPEDVYATLERSMDELCRTHPVSTLCQYDRATTAGVRLDQATATHGGGIRESRLQTAVADGRLVLAGEVDWFNETVLLSAMHAAARPRATSSAAATLRVDLRRVTSLSVDGCRALVVGTERFRDRGGRVRLMASQPIVERVLRLCGLDGLMHIDTARQP